MVNSKFQKLFGNSLLTSKVWIFFSGNIKIKGQRKKNYLDIKLVDLFLLLKLLLIFQNSPITLNFWKLLFYFIVKHNYKYAINQFKN